MTSANSTPRVRSIIPVGMDASFDVTEWDGETPRVIRVAGWTLLVGRVGAAWFAVENRCSHAGSPLDQGRVRRGAILCPLHGARFDLATGKCLGGPYPPLRTFPVAEAQGRVTLTVPDTPPPADHLPVMPV